MMAAILRSLAVLPSLYAVGHGFPDFPTPSGSHCKASPSSASWPSREYWTSFNESLGGQLIQPAPPGGVCHPGQPTYDSDECASIAENWSRYEFHSNDSVSVMQNQFANDTCLPNPSYPCSSAGYPAYVVNATSAEDVKAAVDFAREHEVRLSVKSSGHDFQGRSVAPGSLSIWVHHMQCIQTHTSFQPQGCSFAINHTAVTAAGGTQMSVIYDGLAKINQVAVGGNSKTVSVGGYITGGGHSILAPHYGLGADQVYEMEVVTPMGDIVIANECQNQDLFWAMRGGGGSTFGVITSITVATYPSPEIVGAEISLVTTELNGPDYWDLAGYLLSQFPYLNSKGVSGYAYFLPNYTYLLGNTSLHVAGMVGTFMITETQSTEDMSTIWAPILDHVNKTWPSVIAAPAVKTYSSFSDWYSTHFDHMTAGNDTYVGSHLLDEQAMSDAAELSEAYKVFGKTAATAYLVAGKGVRDAKPRGGGNAVLPSWRRAVVHAVNGISFQPLNATAKAEALEELNASIEPLRKLAPNMGSYLNENNPAEPDWQRSFWGENYERLLEIKRAVDPHDVFWCHPCVGNERWAEVGYQLCRAEGYEDS